MGHWGLGTGTPDKHENREQGRRVSFLFIVGWATRVPGLSLYGGRDAHPTRLDNLFLGVP
jgi:hypothetical protein